MSCFSNIYNPVPPKVWARTENRCAEITDDLNLISPITGKPVTAEIFAYEIKLLHKGNVLQYKQNSSFTKNQLLAMKLSGRYKKFKRTYSTQSQTYTNSNILQLNRQQNTVRQTDVKPTDECPTQSPNVVNNKNTYVMKDGGYLVNEVYEEPCTSQLRRGPSAATHFISTASNVPGPPIMLAWNPRASTYFPKMITRMTSASSKWPVNSQLKPAV